jgi:hypothetical protein
VATKEASEEGAVAFPKTENALVSAQARKVGVAATTHHAEGEEALQAGIEGGDVIESFHWQQLMLIITHDCNATPASVAVAVSEPQHGFG